MINLITNYNNFIGNNDMKKKFQHNKAGNSEFFVYFVTVLCDSTLSGVHFMSDIVKLVHSH